MNGFVEKLKLHKRAQEAIYFAMRERGLIAARLHNAQFQMAWTRRPGNRPNRNRPVQRNRLEDDLLN
jgi:hypothetical protein